jgi:hypothetical protein
MAVERLPLCGRALLKSLPVHGDILRVREIPPRACVRNSICEIQSGRHRCQLHATEPTVIGDNAAGAIPHKRGEVFRTMHDQDLSGVFRCGLTWLFQVQYTTTTTALRRPMNIPIS